MTPLTRTALAPAFLAVLLLAGCSGVLDSRPVPPPTYVSKGFAGDAAGENATLWPNINGTTITVLDNGAFAYACAEAATRFLALTGITVVCEDGGDAGSAIAKLKADAGSGTYDVLYGADNVLLWKAEPFLEPYTPLNGARVPSSALFWGSGSPWPATPVDQGYVAINWDPADFTQPIASLHRVRDNADRFVTQCPNQSSPGLAFMLATIAKFGEWDHVSPGQGTLYDWHDYWNDLFDGGVLVTKDWTDAYENHFTAGYGNDGSHASDRSIVTSYTESPAYEAFYGRPPAQLARVLLEPRSTFHQIQTMGIVKGTDNLAAAQAFVEYALTDHFQGLAAPMSAVYPIVPGIETFSTYQGIDPPADSFATANSALPYDRIGQRLDTWIAEWTEMAPASVQALCGSVDT